MNSLEQEDQTLLDKFAQTKDQIWLVRLFQKYEHLINGVCLKYSNDLEWSKDLKSQIYEKLVVKTYDLKVISFKNWLYTFCKNHCLDEIRKKNRKHSVLDKFRKFQIVADDAVYFSSEDRLIIEEDEKSLQLMLTKATETLSEQQKICMDHFFFKRLSYIEISQETGLDVGQIKSHLQNGKRKMRIFINKQIKRKN